MSATISYREFFEDTQRHLGVIYGTEAEIQAADTGTFATGFIGVCVDSGKVLLWEQDAGVWHEFR